MILLKPESIAEALPDVNEAAKRYWLYCRENADANYLKFNSMIVPCNEKMVGVRAPAIRAVAKPFRKHDKNTIKKFINYLWASKIYEDRVLCAYLAPLVGDWSFVLRMVKTADNWVLTDEICTHSLGPMLLNDAKHFSDLDKLAKSKNTWHRRVAAVSLINWMKSGQPKAKALHILDQLMLDSEPMVKKAVTWMLCEWAKTENADAFNHMMKWARKGNKYTKSVLMNASHKLLPTRKKKLRDAL